MSTRLIFGTRVARGDRASTQGAAAAPGTGSRMSVSAAGRPAPITNETGGGGSGAEREFVLTGSDFARIRTLIHNRAGISLNPGKHNMVYSRLSRRLRACGIATFTQYLDALESGPADAPEWEAFTNALTTNLTAFFREAHHFPALADFLRSRKGETVIWCSAASTGEEPYSIAITACEAFSTMRPPVRIIATDIDTQVLETAKAGTYPVERTDTAGEQRLRRFFLRGTGCNDGKMRVRPEVRALIDFRRVNLLDDAWGIPANLAAIFCRNVLIYFDRPTQAQIVHRFAPLLLPDGLLFAGHSESLAYASSHFRLRGRTIYEKVAGAQP